MALGAALKQFVAGTSVSGQLRPEAFVGHAMQQLILFMVEAANNETSDILERIGREKEQQENKFLIMTFRRSRLFCMLIARCTQQGGKPFETAESFHRFRGRIEKVLNDSV